MQADKKQKGSKSLTQRTESAASKTNLLAVYKITFLLANWQLQMNGTTNINTLGISVHRTLYMLTYMFVIFISQKSSNSGL